MVANTELIERSMKVDVSYATMSFMPAGRFAFMIAISARTARDNSSGLATACLITPILSAGLPLKREMVRSSSAPIATVPRSLMRTG